MIDLSPEHLKIVEKILQDEVPDYCVYAFGSRVQGTAKKFSDLDLALLADEKVPFTALGKLKEAFSESDLPIKVDVLDFQRVAPEFQDVIRRNHIVLSGNCGRSLHSQDQPDKSLPHFDAKNK